jgi:hypothetical protein
MTEVFLLMLLIAAQTGAQALLPDNRQPQPESARFWSLGSPDADHPLRGNREAFRDRMWLRHRLWT